MAKKIKVNIFNDMREALHDVAAYERGEVVNLRVTRVPARPRQISPREIRRIRQANPQKHKRTLDTWVSRTVSYA